MPVALGALGDTIYHPALGGRLQYSLTPVPDGGDGQTESVIGLMARYALEDSKSGPIQSDARVIMSTTPAGGKLTQYGLCCAVWSYVRDRIRFTQDATTAAPIQAKYADPIVEVLIRPQDMSVLCQSGTACTRMGDCDDYSMWTASILLALGIKCAFVTVAADPGSLDYSHVYVAAYPDGERLAIDASHGEYAGWETDRQWRIQEWPIEHHGYISALALILIMGAITLCR